jgi:hypothetical protein
LGATKAVANRMERARVRHGVKIYTPCSPMARRMVQWHSDGMGVEMPPWLVLGRVEEA